MGTFARSLLLVLVLLGLAGPVSAQEEPKDLRWNRFDVDLNLQQDGRLLVTETQEIEYLSGTWRTGGRTIPLDRVEDITDVRVSEVLPGGETRELDVDTSVQGNELQIAWQYAPTSGGESRTFQIEYTAIGVVRDYGQEEQPNQQIRWQALPQERRFPIESSTVNLRFPTPIPFENLAFESYPESLGGTAEAVEGGVRFQVESVPAFEGFEIRAKFPANTVQAPAPEWQQEADRADRLNEAVQPRNNLLLLGLGLLVPTAGLMGLLVLWLTRGKDPGVGRDAESINVPPSDLPAPLAGVLLDERADVQDVVSTIISLSERGVLRITEVRNDELLGSNRDFRLELIQPYNPEQLRTYERTLVDNLCSQGDSVMLSEARGRFMAAVPVFRDQLYEEVTRAGLFKGNPEKVRNRYRSLGVGLIVVAAVLGCLGLSAFSAFADPFFVILPTIGLVVVGFGLMQLSKAMPVRTLNGAVEASRWRSFRNYLAHIERTPDISQDKGAFERYLSYATAFGLGRSWLDKFSSVGTPAPAWYRRGRGGDMDVLTGGRGGYGGGGFFGGPVIIVPPFGGYGGGGHHGSGGGVGGAAGAAGGVGPADTGSGDLFGGTGMFDFGDNRNVFDRGSGGLADLFDQASDAFGGWDAGGGFGGGWGGGGGGGFGGGSGGGGADFG